MTANGGCAMKLSISRSKNAASLYVTKSVYRNGKYTSCVVEKLGTEKELREKLAGEDPYAWAKAYVEQRTRQEKQNDRKVVLEYSTCALVPKGEQRCFNGGYLFLQKIYYELKLHKICAELQSRYKITFSLHEVLRTLIYARILYPGSKLAAFEIAKNFIEQPTFELQHVYRALEVLAKESDTIQASLYRNSLKICPRNASILYYDCTNFFFETEQPEGLRQYGHSKEHKPNPIVQMGLFMDGSGLPLAFTIQEGNANEQTTLQPLEQQILRDFALSRFVICTDAGLSSVANRKFNDTNNRCFVTTQSIKKLKKHLREWALDTADWRLEGDTSSKRYDLSKMFDVDWDDPANENGKQGLRSKTLFKERWIHEDGLEQRLIVTYSSKYAQYQKYIRNQQVERAQKLLDSGAAHFETRTQNDHRRFISKQSFSSDGQSAKKTRYLLNHRRIQAEEAFDGFYAVCTNLQDPAGEILKINHSRWKIEESFRILKSQFKSRPVYLSRDDRIKAHFTTCFIALLIYRLLEKRLDDSFSCDQIVSGLRDLTFHKTSRGFLPSYTRCDFSDHLHQVFGFRTDLQIIDSQAMTKLIKRSKS
jgi:transposase